MADLLVLLQSKREPGILSKLFHFIPKKEFESFLRTLIGITYAQYIGFFKWEDSFLKLKHKFYLKRCPPMLAASCCVAHP